MMGYGSGTGAVGWIVMGVFWLLIIGTVVWAVGSVLPRESNRDGRSDRPEDILDRRFALGEIDAQRYRQAREELAASRPGRR
jgi:putative membrane protein